MKLIADTGIGPPIKRLLSSKTCHGAICPATLWVIPVSLVSRSASIAAMRARRILDNSPASMVGST